MKRVAYKTHPEPSSAYSQSSMSLSSLTKGERCRLRTRETCAGMGRFIYNKKERTVCNKTCKNWGLLLLFYLVFLGLLFGLFFAILFLMVRITEKSSDGPFFDRNTLVTDESPALGLIPRLPVGTTPLIWYTSFGEETRHNAKPDTYISVIDKFLKKLDKTDKKRYVDCSVKSPKDGEYCSFTREDLGPCGQSTYGYHSQTPCVYLKLNMFEDWKPSRKRKKHYNVLRFARGNDTLVDEQDSEDMIPLKCQGMTPFDTEHMGNMSFYPEAGFKDHFFPYDGSLDYIRPIIGIQFENLARGMVIGIKCIITEIENMKDPLLHSINFYFYI